MDNKVGDKLFFSVYRNIYLRRQIYNYIKKKEESEMYNLIMSIDTWNIYIELLQYSYQRMSIKNIKLIIISCVWIFTMDTRVTYNLNIGQEVQSFNIYGEKLQQKIIKGKLPEIILQNIITDSIKKLRICLESTRFNRIIDKLNISINKNKNPHFDDSEIGKLLYKDIDFYSVFSHKRSLYIIDSNFTLYNDGGFFGEYFETECVIGLLISFFSRFTDYLYYYMLDYLKGNNNAKKIESYVTLFTTTYNRKIDHKRLCRDLLLIKPFNFYIINYVKSIASMNYVKNTNMTDEDYINTFVQFICEKKIPYGYICRKMCEIIISTIRYNSDIPRRLGISDIKKYGKRYKELPDVNLAKNSPLEYITESEYNTRNREISKLLLINKLVTENIL